MKRTDVYKLIDGERDYQDELFSEGGKFHGDQNETGHEVGEHILILSAYANKAIVAWTDNAGSEQALNVIRKIAAVAVRALEEHGAPAR